jgi:hypothetical protein
MAATAFDPTITIVNTLSGGVNSIDRVLLLSRGTAQATAATSLTNQFASRIDAALAKLDKGATTPISEALLRQQSQLISRKDRINDAIGVLNQAFTQIGFLRNHVDYLQEQVAELEAGNITAAALSVDFDNKLRKINQLAAAGAQSFKDGGIYFQKNLIGSLSRSSFATQTLFAPYNSNGDTLQIDGAYLGTDYFIAEDTSGDIFKSDTGFAASEETVGTLTEYSSDHTTATGVSDTVTDLSFTSIDGSDNVVFQLSDSTSITGVVSRGGLGILDAWLYSNFDTSSDTTALTRVKADLDKAESILLLREADFLADRATLQSRATVFDTQIGGLQNEILSIAEDIQSDRQAELLAAELEFQVAQFQFSLLAARGNTLVFSLVLAQDNGIQPNTQASSEAVLGATLSVNV